MFVIFTELLVCDGYINELRKYCFIENNFLNYFCDAKKFLEIIKMASRYDGGLEPSGEDIFILL